jgi:DNA-binding GntR family transcriptional regulator
MPQIREAPAKYLQIASFLRDQIIRGDLPPGAEVPSERQIADEWKVSRPTATRALQVLRYQGLVESRQGAGTYVRDVQMHRRAVQRYHRYRERGAQYAPDESLEITAAEITSAPDYVALGGIGSVRYVESVTGRQAAYARDQVSARLASAEELRDLDLTGPAAVLIIRHVVYDTEDVPLEYAEAVYPPGQWTAEQEYTIES